MLTLVVAPNFLHFVYHFANIVFVLIEELEINVVLNIVISALNRQQIVPYLFSVVILQ